MQSSALLNLYTALLSCVVPFILLLINPFFFLLILTPFMHFGRIEVVSIGLSINVTRLRFSARAYHVQSKQQTSNGVSNWNIVVM